MDTKQIDRSAENIRIRHSKRQKQRKMMMKRRRIIFFSTVGLILLSIILFFTPLFNIKNINITGNSKVETAEIKQIIGSVEEENLFRLRAKKIIANIKTVPYVEDVSIKKRIFPVGINVEVIECIPVGYIQNNESYIIFDKTFKVLEITDAPLENVTEMLGIAVTSSQEGAVMTTDDSEKLSEISQVCARLIDEEIISKIGTISFEDMNNIKFTYENRLDVICGSVVDFSKKIGMFKKAVASSKLTENSRGTIDISISGKAIYTP
ncbi:MAG: FtsQ-type POTRA domain-containing protein [Clostridia bacterium]|nr:FtsQ-type POTRA domain-containing protein [Clostridia bacterium]